MGNIHISGSGKVAADGNIYDEVHISGSGRVDGSFSCKEIHISGSGRLNGDVTCEGDIRTSGSGHFEGNVSCRGISVSGSAHFEKNVKCSGMSISGACHIDGSIEGGDISVSGAVKVNGDLTAESVRLSGAGKIGGLLNAENIEIRLNNNDTNISEIGCTTLRVVPQNSGSGVFKLFGMHFGGSANLNCKTIEGDNLYLCNTVAEVVRGKIVKIGPGCVIAKVEYSESLEVDKNAQVKEEIKI